MATGRHHFGFGNGVGWATRLLGMESTRGQRMAAASRGGSALIGGGAAGGG
jgi:hypothetical protein